MSDFIFSKKSIKHGKLTEEIQAIYKIEDSPTVEEFHGEWGSLAVSHNLYNGFQPYETDEHICVVLGGPVLYFQDNNFLNNKSGVEGSQAIYNRILNGVIQWEEDLSGPFVILLINKITSELRCITDLMSFIPVYSFQDSTNILLSSHVDVLARTSNQQGKIDKVSVADFILHGIVTYPYTVYTNIRQIAPASKHSITKTSCKLLTESYWIPEETDKYKSIGLAAKNLRQALQHYTNKIAGEMTNVAQFISGGEDSRVLSGLLPKSCTREAFIFLNKMNRAGQVAKKAAGAYGAHFKLATRSEMHYLEILPASVDLVGGGSQYTHAHTFGFHKSCRLNEYSAVFGGLFSDALLKGARVRKKWGSGYFSFLPQIKKRDYSPANPIKNSAFTFEVLSLITKRRQSHLNDIKAFRKESSEEWFELWPSSMNMNIPNLHANRRLFRSYEPFMSKDVVKIMATVPQKWKLNRRLFNRAVKPFLKPTKWLFHSDGWLPYFPWYINTFIQLIMKIYQKVSKLTGLVQGHQGPWGEWNVVLNSPEWEKSIDNYSGGIDVISSILKEKDIIKLFKGNHFNQVQCINLLQILYSNHKNIN